MWSKATLIISSVGGAGDDPPPRKMNTFFLRTLQKKRSFKKFSPATAIFCSKKKSSVYFMNILGQKQKSKKYGRPL